MFNLVCKVCSVWCSLVLCWCLCIYIVSGWVVVVRILMMVIIVSILMRVKLSCWVLVCMDVYMIVVFYVYGECFVLGVGGVGVDEFYDV